MIQNFVKFILPSGQHIHPNDFREGVAKQLDKQSFEGKFDIFNYVDENNTRMARPKNCFLGGSGWVGFTAESNPLLVSKVIAPSITFLMEKGINAQTMVGEQEKSAWVTEKPHIYRITKLADQRDTARAKKGYRRTPSEHIEKMIEKMFNDAFDEGIIDNPIDKEDIHLAVLDAQSKGESVTFKKNTAKSIAKLSATISMNVELSGAWQAGHLQSRGYGLIYSVNHGGYSLCPI
jgi:hypothetical protein